MCSLSLLRSPVVVLSVFCSILGFVHLICMREKSIILVLIYVNILFWLQIMFVNVAGKVHQLFSPREKQNGLRVREMGTTHVYASTCVHSLVPVSLSLCLHWT